MPMQYTVFYNQGVGGWTETFYANTETFYEDPANTAGFTEFFNASRDVRAPGTKIYGFRQSLIGGARKISQFQKFGDKFKTPAGSAGDLPDLKTTDALCYIYNVDRTLKRPIYVRGLLDSDTVRSGSFDNAPTAALITKLNKFFAQMRGLGSCTRRKELRNVDPWVPRKVISVTPNLANPNTSDVQFSPAVSALLNQQILFAKIPTNDLPGFPRIATVLQAVGIPTGIATIAYRLRSSVVPYTPSKMTGRLLFYEYIGDYSWQFWDFSEHKTGRPFGSLPGKARAKVRAQ